MTAGVDEAALGRDLIEQAGGLNQALRLHHPDRGGDPANLRAVLAARDEDPDA